MRCFSVWHSPVFMGVRWGDKMGICHHLEIGTKNQKFLSSLIDLILAMTVLFSDMTLTLHKSRVHCCGVIQF